MLLPLAAALAVAEIAGAGARIKWPNDVLVDGRKVAGILAEGRPQDGWAVLGIGLNVALRIDDLPPELRDTAGTLGLAPADLEPTLERRCSRPTAPATPCAVARSDGRPAAAGRGASTAPGA